MELRHRKAGDGDVYVASSGSDVLGYVAVDSTVAGRCSGGLRMAPDVDEAEIRALARAMTLKYGLLGLPQGGGKAGVRGDPEAPLAERLDRLVEFGRAIAPLLRDGTYTPFQDMGTCNSDIRHMLKAVGVQVARRNLRENRSGYYTACSVFAGVVQAAGRLGLDLRRCKAAVEGFGKVGAPLAGMLAGAGVKVTAISTSHGAIHDPAGLDVNRLTRIAGKVGGEVVEVYREAQAIARHELPKLPVDILCPCARHGSLHEGNAASVQARVISPGANNPVTTEAERLLSDRGVLCLTDFVTNCGGTLGGTMEFAAIPHRRIVTCIRDRVGALIAALLDEAERTGRPLRAVAEALALRRFEAVRRSAEHRTLGGRLFELGLSAYRRGLVPAFLMRRLSPRYFERKLTEAIKSCRFDSGPPAP